MNYYLCKVLHHGITVAETVISAGDMETAIEVTKARYDIKTVVEKGFYRNMTADGKYVSICAALTKYR